MLLRGPIPLEWWHHLIYLMVTWLADPCWISRPFFDEFRPQGLFFLNQILVSTIETRYSANKSNLDSSCHPKTQQQILSLFTDFSFSRTPMQLFLHGYKHCGPNRWLNTPQHLTCLSPHEAIAVSLVDWAIKKKMNHTLHAMDSNPGWTPMHV